MTTLGFYKVCIVFHTFPKNKESLVPSYYSTSVFFKTKKLKNCFPSILFKTYNLPYFSYWGTLLYFFNEPGLLRIARVLCFRKQKTLSTLSLERKLLLIIGACFFSSFILEDIFVMKVYKYIFK